MDWWTIVENTNQARLMLTGLPQTQRELWTLTLILSLLKPSYTPSLAGQREVGPWKHRENSMEIKLSTIVHPPMGPPDILIPSVPPKTPLPSVTVWLVGGERGEEERV